MIEKITIKFGTELKPTQNSYKLQLCIPYVKWVVNSETLIG